MHGIIFAELNKYVSTKHGAQTWPKLLKEAGFEFKTYLALNTYPDEEVVAIVTTASKLLGKPVAAILEDFGEFIVPDLIGMYKNLIKKEWKTLDLLLNTEETVHRVVRIKNPGAQPPKLDFTKSGDNELLFNYTSPRKLYPVAKGMIRGVGKYYKEQVEFVQETPSPTGGCKVKIRIKK